MKVAICLSGLYRTFDECYPTILDNLINYNKHLNFDLIAFFPQTESKINLDKYSFKKYIIESDEKIPNLDYQFKKYIYEDHTCINNYYQLLGLKKVNELRKSIQEEYDLIARVRTDFKFLSPINLQEIKWDKIYIPYGHDHREGINDRFAIGPTNMMDFYLDRYNFWMNKHDDIPGYCTHAELNLKIYLNHLNIPIGRIPFNYCLRRPNEDLGTIIL